MSDIPKSPTGKIHALENEPGEGGRGGQGGTGGSGNTGGAGGQGGAGGDFNAQGKTQQIIEKFPNATVLMLTILWASLLMGVGASIWASSQTITAQRLIAESANVRMEADKSKKNAFIDLDALSKRDLRAPTISRFKNTP